MSRIKASLDHKRIRRLIWLVLTFFVLLGYSLQNVAGSAYYSIVMQPYATVTSPPVILEEGNCSGTTTIYTNNTSAKVKVAAPAPVPTYYPSSYTMLKGTHVSGNMTSLQTVDSDYFVTESEVTGWATENYLWISSGEDFIYKVDPADPTVAISSWDTGTSYPFGVEYIDGYIYYVDYGTDLLYKTVDGTGEVLASWDISAYSLDAYGLGWNGTHIAISDTKDDAVYIVDPADPTTPVATFSGIFPGVSAAEGVCWANGYWWVTDSSADKVFKLDTVGNVVAEYDIGSATFQIFGAAAITWNGSCWWITDTDANVLEVLDANFTTRIATHNDPSSDPQGLAYASLQTPTEHTVDTQFEFSGMTTETPTQLNFTVVTQYNATSVNVTIQVWNYSSSAYVTSGEGYANYTSSGSNETTDLSINTNPQFYTSSGNAKIKVTGELTTNSTYQQETNQIKLVYKYDASSTYDYVLAVTEQDSVNWTINLQVYSSSNIIARALNTTISFHDGTTSDQIIISGGSIDQSEGPPYNLTGSATIYIKMSNVGATSSGTSYIYVYLKILVPDTSTYALYVITFEIT